MDSSIGPYSIQRLINQGGQGQVYLGFDQRLHRQVAIKIHRLPDGRRARRRVLEEAQRVAAIQSPRVVQIYDVVQSSDYLAMVMEYVPGCDLEDFLCTSRPSVASIVSVGMDLAVALAASRQQGLVHGDLKAANVLITPQGRVKLTDFGIARSADDDAQRVHAGSLCAIAPEQLAGLALDIRTDLFALGRLLYRMLTGEHSFSRAGTPDPNLLLQEDQAPVAEALQSGETAPAELLLLVDQLLRKLPQQRPRNTHQVRRILRSVSKQLPLSTSDNLLHEAKPCFRPESPADIPLQIPSQLRHRGRSSNTRNTLARRWRGWLPPRSPALALVAVVLMGVAIPLVAAWQGRATRIHIEVPVLDIPADRRLPELIHGAGLTEVIRHAIEGEVPGVRFTGAVKTRAIYASDRDVEPDEIVALSLRCDALFCLFFLQRQLAGQTSYQQVLLDPEQSGQYWQRQINEAVAALYR